MQFLISLIKFDRPRISFWYFSAVWLFRTLHVPLKGRPWSCCGWICSWLVFRCLPPACVAACLFSLTVILPLDHGLGLVCHWGVVIPSQWITKWVGLMRLPDSKLLSSELVSRGTPGANSQLGSLPCMDNL